LIRTRIASVVGIAALAVAGSLFATGTAQASTPTTPYMCPPFLNDGATGLYWWTEGQAILVCVYNSTGTLYCRYNAYIGTPVSGTGEPLNNASYCPAKAVPTT
jgi:hypothetical protein